MEHPSARPKAPKRRPAVAPSPPAPAPPQAPPGARRKGRPPKGDDAARVRDLPGFTVRADAELLARLDAVVAQRNRELALLGAATSRGAMATLALREFCEREEAKHAPSGGAS